MSGGKKILMLVTIPSIFIISIFLYSVAHYPMLYKTRESYKTYKNFVTEIGALKAKEKFAGAEVRDRILQMSRFVEAYEKYCNPMPVLHISKCLDIERVEIKRITKKEIERIIDEYRDNYKKFVKFLEKNDGKTLYAVSYESSNLEGKVEQLLVGKVEGKILLIKELGPVMTDTCKPVAVYLVIAVLLVILLHLFLALREASRVFTALMAIVVVLLCLCSVFVLGDMLSLLCSMVG